MKYRYYLVEWKGIRDERILYRIGTNINYYRLRRWNPYCKDWRESGWTLSDLKSDNRVKSVREIAPDKVDVELTMMELIL